MIQNNSLTDATQIITVADMPKKNAPSPRMVFTITKDISALLVKIKQSKKLRSWQHAFEEMGSMAGKGLK